MLEKVPARIETPANIPNPSPEAGENNLEISDLSREISEVLGDSVSEKKGDHRPQKTQKNGKSAKNLTVSPLHTRPLPSLNLMRRKVIANSIQEKNLLLETLEKAEQNPYLYADTVKKLRSLQVKINSLWKLAGEQLRQTYLQIFGHQHGFKKEEDLK
ncbi:MAG TPA: hypothetical protein PLQ36_02215 [Candidatus Gracilibacteria bacterium]|nr:hypothetical protein [Candidatus Gracilibacteria bacterium]